MELDLEVLLGCRRKREKLGERETHTREVARVGVGRRVGSGEREGGRGEGGSWKVPPSHSLAVVGGRSRTRTPFSTSSSAPPPPKGIKLHLNTRL